MHWHGTLRILMTIQMRGSQISRPHWTENLVGQNQRHNQLSGLRKTWCSFQICTIVGIMPWSSTIVTDQLSATPSLSHSTSTLSAPLKSSARHPCIWIEGPHFSLHSIGKSLIHHQLIASAGALIMAYRPEKITEQLLGHLPILL